MGIDVLIIRHQDEVLKDLAIQFPNIKFINAGEGTIQSSNTSAYRLYDNV